VSRTAAIRITMPLALLLATSPLFAATVNVQVGGAGFNFSPQHVVIIEGDSVQWTNMGGFHNVRSDDCASALVPGLGCTFRCANGCDGQGGNGAPSSAAWQATVAFATPGVVGYHCQQHGSPGSSMFGTVTVLGIVLVDGFEDETPDAWTATVP